MRAVHLTIFILFYFTLTRGSNSCECIAECLNKQYEYEYEYGVPEVPTFFFGVPSGTSKVYKVTPMQKRLQKKVDSYLVQTKCQT